MSHRPDVTAIVVTYDSAGVLPACLDALAAEGVPAIVVDNASGDDSAGIAERTGATVIRNARNEGFGRAMNIGVRAAQTEFCLLTNPDLTYQPGAVAALVAAAARWPDAGLLAPRILEPDGRFFWQARSLLSPYLQNPRGVLSLPQGDCCAPFLSGASLLARRELFLSLGGFDENIFLFYEDDDLCRRVAEAGHALVHVHDAEARHVRGGSSAPAPGRIFRARWHMAWSRRYAARKWGLRDDSLGTALVNGLKALGGALVLNRRLVERYGGSSAGAWAALRGHSALEREGLQPSRR
jgi:N-acetylglucosaminyl-diphospho-decaprenol L-rhamnosyltransferase